MAGVIASNESKDQSIASSKSPPRYDYKSLPWYVPTLQGDSLSQKVKEILHVYSGIEEEKIVEHVLDIRDKAFEIFPYPCIGGFRFLDFNLGRNPYYQEALNRVKEGQILLDLGCCFGQELRKLVFDGAPSENLYGSDLRMDFINLGYDLFLDKDKFHAHFIAADILDPESDLIKRLTGKVDMVYTGSFLHLFDWEEQVEVAKQIAKLLRPKPGSLIMGRQIGNKKPGSYPRRSGGGFRFRHDESTLVKMWEEVTQTTNVKFKVESSMLPLPSVNRLWQEEGVTSLLFSARRE